MSNITEKSKYNFTVEFEYPDPYALGPVPDQSEPVMMPVVFHASVVETNLADAYDELQRQWKKKYDLEKIFYVKVHIEVTPIEETLPPAA